MKNLFLGYFKKLEDGYRPTIYRTSISNEGHTTASDKLTDPRYDADEVSQWLEDLLQYDNTYCPLIEGQMELESEIDDILNAHAIENITPNTKNSLKFSVEGEHLFQNEAILRPALKLTVTTNGTEEIHYFDVGFNYPEYTEPEPEPNVVLYMGTVAENVEPETEFTFEVNVQGANPDNITVVLDTNATAADFTSITYRYGEGGTQYPLVITDGRAEFTVMSNPDEQLTVLITATTTAQATAHSPLIFNLSYAGDLGYVQVDGNADTTTINILQ